MCSIHNRGKYAVAERFIRTLKYEMYKYMTLVSKNVYINKWDDRVNKYSNSTIKMKAVDVKSSTYIDFGTENNAKFPKFKIGDHVKISKYKNIFAKVYTSNWPEDIFVIKIVKRTVPWTCVISNIDSEEVAGMFYEK